MFKSGLETLKHDTMQWLVYFLSSLLAVVENAIRYQKLIYSKNCFKNCAPDFSKEFLKSCHIEKMRSSALRTYYNSYNKLCNNKWRSISVVC